MGKIISLEVNEFTQIQYTSKWTYFLHGLENSTYCFGLDKIIDPNSDKKLATQFVWAELDTLVLIRRCPLQGVGSQ